MWILVQECVDTRDSYYCKCRPGYSGKFCQDSLTRGEDTVLSQLPVTDNTLEELQTEDVFPSKLGNALEKL